MSTRNRSGTDSPSRSESVRFEDLLDLGEVVDAVAELPAPVVPLLIGHIRPHRGAAAHGGTAIRAQGLRRVGGIHERRLGRGAGRVLVRDRGLDLLGVQRVSTSGLRRIKSMQSACPRMIAPDGRKGYRNGPNGTGPTHRPTTTVIVKEPAGLTPTETVTSAATTDPGRDGRRACPAGRSRVRCPAPGNWGSSPARRSIRSSSASSGTAIPTATRDGRWPAFPSQDIVRAVLERYFRDGGAANASRRGERYKLAPLLRAPLGRIGTA